MPRLFFTSDEHYGHRRVIDLCARPFVGSEHQTEELVRRHNDVVRSDDVVFHLGDFAWREQDVAPLLRRLNGQHHLVAGNHDGCFSAHKKSAKARERYLRAGFVTIVERVSIRVAGVDVLLSHLPYRHPEGVDQRYAELRPIDRGGWLLHGHVHVRWTVNGRQINVGVDAWNFAPVGEDELASVMRRAA